MLPTGCLVAALRSDARKYYALVRIYAIYRHTLLRHKLATVLLANKYLNDLISTNLANRLEFTEEIGFAKNSGEISSPQKQWHQGALFSFNVSQTTENMLSSILMPS